MSQEEITGPAAGETTSSPPGTSPQEDHATTATPKDLPVVVTTPTPLGMVALTGAEIARLQEQAGNRFKRLAGSLKRTVKLAAEFGESLPSRHRKGSR